MTAQTYFDSKKTEQTPETTLRVNGRSFYWARFFLGANAGSKATQLYSFCRYLDDIADGDHDGGLPLLTEIRHELAGQIPVRNKKIQNYLSLYDDKLAARTYALSLLDGLISDQSAVKLKSEKELVRYAYRVAGTVGLMMSPFLGVQSKKALPFAIDLGIAMQLTNICRDVLEDAETGRRYLPLSNKDLSPGTIARTGKDIRPEVRQQINATLELADKYYESGLSGLYYLSPQARRAISVSAYVYRQIGIKLRLNRTAWWQGRTVVSTPEKIKPTIHALRSIRKWTATEPEHNSELHRYLVGLPETNCFDKPTDDEHPS